MEKINNWINENSDHVPYIGMCYKIIERSLINKNDSMVFKNIKTKKKRKILYTLAEALGLSFSNKIVDTKTFIDLKKISNPPMGYSIDYYPTRYGNESWNEINIGHKPLGKCGYYDFNDRKSYCKFCDSLPSFECEYTYKNVYLTKKNDKDMPKIREIKLLRERHKQVDKPKIIQEPAHEIIKN
jgi:hypothetical protein